MVKRFWDWLRGGSKAFYACELVVVHYVAHSLPEKDAEVLKVQAHALRLVQRPSKQMTLCFYPKDFSAPVFDGPNNEACLAMVKLSPQDKRKRTVKLMIHHGRLHRIEGEVPSDLTEAQLSEPQLWPSTCGKSVAEALDRLEHGK